MHPHPETCPACAGTQSAFSALLGRRIACPHPMSTPTPQGPTAYAWAWLRHGPLLPYVRAGTIDLYAAQLYPRGTPGWVEGRLIVRAGAWWAQHATEEERSVVEHDAILAAPPHLVPAPCAFCSVLPKDPAGPCYWCFGTGILHAHQPPSMLRPIV